MNINGYKEVLKRTFIKQWQIKFKTMEEVSRAPLYEEQILRKWHN